MHVAITLFTLFATWRWSDWKNWQKYHHTLLFIALGNLLYNFICANYFLWRLEPDFLSNHSLTEMLYTFIVFPSTALLFLSNYPKKSLRQFLHYVKYFLIYIVVEWIIGIKLGRISYNYGWNLGWSALFLCGMFPILRIHYSRPLVAYLLSLFMLIGIILYFDVPVDVPVEDGIYQR